MTKTEQDLIYKLVNWNESLSFSAYQEVLRTQVPKLRQQIKQTTSFDREKVAFTFYDTYGVPLDVIESVFRETGATLSREVFQRYLEEQKDRSRASSKITKEIFADACVTASIEGLASSKFLGYDATHRDAKLQRIAKTDDGVETELLLIFEQTPFYAESGGQIGDTGEISGKKFKAKVLDAQFIGKCIAHKAQILEGRPEEGEIYTLKVDAERRADIMKNHTATHLLHSALRKVLGDHVKQRGSLVAPDYLRFDFTHSRAVDAESLNKIEELVNEQVKKNIRLEKEVLPKAEALKRGAIAFFGEKYGEDVRVVSIGDFSMELCGGTHLDSTGPIGLFKITSEGSIQAGVRRIEAVTGRGAEQLILRQNRDLEKICATFRVRKDSLKEDLKEKVQGVAALKNRLGQSAASKIKNHLSDAIARSTATGGAKLVSETLDGADVDLMRSGFEHLKSVGASFAMFLTSGDSEKVSFSVGGSPDLVQKGFNAGKIVQLIAQQVEGNGGGRSDFAVGGGKRIDKKGEALAFGEKEILRELAGISGKAGI
jgi:alanyl-tRNA synthetase